MRLRGVAANETIEMLAFLLLSRVCLAIGSRTAQGQLGGTRTGRDIRHHEYTNRNHWRKLSNVQHRVRKWKNWQKSINLKASLKHFLYNGQMERGFDNSAIFPAMIGLSKSLQLEKQKRKHNKTKT